MAPPGSVSSAYTTSTLGAASSASTTTHTRTDVETQPCSSVVKITSWDPTPSAAPEHGRGSERWPLLAWTADTVPRA